MRSRDFEIVTVASGARSLRSLEHGETFHPVVGPMIEARALHVQQQRLVERAAQAEARAEKLRIWDVGLGAAANAIAVIEALQGGPDVELHSFERDPSALAFALEHAEVFTYPTPHTEVIRKLLADGFVKSGSISWQLHLGDFRVILRERAFAPPHAVIFDPYSPAANPALWTHECFAQIAEKLSPEAPCMLTHYSRSTAVRAGMLLAGFYVGHGAEVGEKDETTAAANTLDLLDRPLGERWLQRALRSTNGRPPSDLGTERGMMDDAMRAALLAHPQFTKDAVSCSR